MNTKKYVGMSLTDRLTQAGSLNAFSKALKDKDEMAALALLLNVEFTHDQASDTVKSLLLDPNSDQNFK